MEIGKQIHNFTLVKKSEVPDISAVAYYFKHKSGLSLIYLDREDENKLFSIAFKTYPTDNTGVFHIIEHSVLCGSRKYPVKEPFAELLKGSLKTLLNAYTYRDKTVYPVASRNEKDFHNLIEVYLDAVFHPNLTENENIFLREGHRLEPDGDGYKLNGVVYNEMLSGCTSAGEIADTELASLLFPSGTYSYNSGGAPEAIPSLTYEKFKEEYIRHYNPSNAFAILDGRMDIEKTLGIIDTSLLDVRAGSEVSGFSLGKRPITEKKTVCYQTGDGEGVKDKSRLYLGYRISKFSDRKKSVAFAVLSDALAGANTSPLRRKILKSGLCDGFYMGVDDGGEETTLVVEAKGVKDGKEDTLRRIYRETLAKFVKWGLPKKELLASILSMEFKTREADSGNTPVGFLYASAIYDSWLYGGDPLANLSFSQLFLSLKEGIENGYFENLLEELLSLDEACLLLLPSTTLEVERRSNRDEALHKMVLAMSEEEVSLLKEKNNVFLTWQEKADEPQDLKKIPSLSLCDVCEMREEIPKEFCKISGTDVLFTKINTRGIVYTDLYFDISDCEYTSELFALVLLFSEMDTKEGDAAYMRNRIKSRLGSLTLTLSPIKRDESTRLYLVLKASALNSQKDELVKLLYEYIYTGKMPSVGRSIKKIKQLTDSLLSSLSYNSVGAALARLGAEYDTLSLFSEYWYGVSGLKNYKEMVKNPRRTHRTLKKILKDFQTKYFVKERLTLGITGEVDREFASKLIGALRLGEGIKEIYTRPLFPKENVGVVIPASVATVIRGAQLESYEEFRTGEQAVFASILDYEILWNEIRLKGGAYDTGYVSQRAQKMLSLYSSSEPDPERADCVFKDIGRYAVAFLDRLSDADFERYIIGAIGESEPLSSPKLDGSAEIMKYLAKRGRKEEEEKHRQMLAFDKEAFVRAGELLASVMERSKVVIFGSKDLLEKMSLDRIIEI